MPDHRINFPSTLVDFINTVGVTGQTHDEYPSPGAQARYDHLRLFLIGLLSNQSSYLEPTNYREGTLWFDLNDLRLKIRRSVGGGSTWVNVSDSIKLGDTDLTAWFTSVNLSLESVTPEIVFRGTIVTQGIDYISIPGSISSYIGSNTKAYVTINGDNANLSKRLYVLSPQDVTIEGAPPVLLRLATVTLDTLDTFMVVLRSVPSATFVSDPITVV
jgi:hypothetical protein